MIINIIIMDVGILKKLLEFGNKNNWNNKIGSYKKKIILSINKIVRIMGMKKLVVYRMERINE